MFWSFGTGRIIDIGQCVELVHDDVDVVASDAVTLAGDTFSFVHASYGVKLAALHFTVDGVEMSCYGIYSCWVADEDDAVGQLFGTEVQVEARSVAIDDEF